MKELAGKRLLFVDIETTGLIPADVNSFRDFAKMPRILQLSWILSKYEITGFECSHYFSFLISQYNLEITAQAEKIHNFTKSEIMRNGYPSNYVFQIFLNSCNVSDCIVVFNEKFDITILKSWLYAKSMRFDVFHEKVFDVQKYIQNNYATELKLQGKYPSLSKCMQYFCPHFVYVQHDALGDCTALQNLTAKLIRITNAKK